MRIAVLDYGSGNLRSAARAVAAVGGDVVVTADLGEAAAADGLVVPGVGAFGACMSALRKRGADELIEKQVAASRPVLAICVGMQVLFEYGDEHGERTAGLSLLPGGVTALRAQRLPHMGWNTVTAPANSTFFAGTAPQTRFYFVHSFAAKDTAGVVTYAEYGGDRFVAAVERGSLWATQFHPEKSADAGARILRNWIQSFA